MKTRLKIFMGIVLVALSAVLVCGVLAENRSDDPSKNYVAQTAPNEDSSIRLWFDYSFRKNLTSDVYSTGMHTFSIYMAKNEIEDAQFVLYSATDKVGLTADVTDFTDKNGNTIDAEIYYEMYVTVSGISTGNYLYSSLDSQKMIRTGETPDPIAPLANVGKFKLNGGKSQAFLIRAKTTSESVSGWYSAQLNVYNSAGETVKTATVYAYVWDFEIPEKTTLQTSFFINNNRDYGGDYQTFYDYMLENRLCGMDVPGELSPTNPYLTNPRVNAIRITSGGGGAAGYYADQQVSTEYGNIYARLRENDEFWQETKDKYYFYSADEPVAALPWTGWNIDRTVGMGLATENYWPNAQLVVPHHEDTPYPDNYYTQPMSYYQDYQRKDANQQLIEAGGVTVWCPMVYAFNSNAVLSYYGNPSTIRDMSGFISGVYYTPDKSSFYYATYDWEAEYGDFYDRIMSEIYLQNQKGNDQYKMWAYGCGNNNAYTYCNHLIENTGLQTKLLFWQMYQNDVTGYLYYGTNNWTEYTTAYDSTVTGSKTTCQWMTNEDRGYSVGNGVLFYGSSQGKIKGLKVIGSLRVEILRDSVEEYEMLTMLNKLKGDTVADNIVKSVSQNVANYISLPKFNRSKFANSLDNYDVMETVRRQLGNTLEAAVLEGECEHVWDNGTVTKNAKCIKAGEKTYTCTLCGVQKKEIIPTLHSVGDCFEKISGSAATCTSNGNEVLRCTICGFRKTVYELSHHVNNLKYNYSYKSDILHNNLCPDCGAILDTGRHSFITIDKKPTCTEDGSRRTACRLCDYETENETTPAIGHNFVDGVCANCGEEKEEEKYLPGDANMDGKRNNQDINTMRQIITGNIDSSDLVNKICDITGDGKVTALDVNVLTKIVTGVYNG